MKTNIPKNFIWLNLTQAIGSFMDNLFKMLTVFYLAGGLGLRLDRTLALATVLLVVPFIFLSNLAGALADHYSKTTLIRIGKWAELALIAISFPAYFSGQAWPMLAVLALLACQSAFFGPLKRGIIPEIVPGNAVAEANGVLSATSYLGIIAGMVLPSVLCSRVGMPYWGVLVLAAVVSSIGLAASYGIPDTVAQGRPISTSWRIATDTFVVFRSIRPRRMLFQAALGAAAFSGLAALFQQSLLLFARDELGMTVEEAGLPFFFVATGIMTGSRLAGRYGRGALDAGCIPAGAMAMTLGLATIALTSSRTVFGLALVVAGLGGGLCLVPLNTYLQTRSDPDRRGEILGASETASFAAIVASSALVAILCGPLGLSARALAAATAAMAAFAAFWALRVLPCDAFRFILSRLTRLCYDVRVQGIENIPGSGGALLAMNHTAFVDAPVVQSVIGRSLRFVMSREIFSSWKWCRPFFRLAGAIQIHATDNAKALVRSINAARDALRGGELLAIYPEGELTTTGRIEEFHRGFEKMAKGTDAPIIPIYIGNLWGSIFSHACGSPGLHLPRHLLPRRVTVRIGRPLPSTSTAQDVRAAVVALSAA